jgi:hypothetical protein
MIRKSLFVALALLLYPCLRNAADPGAASSMKVGPARACDNGDTIPVPAMAATAGFSQCVLNADFTKLDGFFSRTSNFIDGCGGVGTKIFQAYYAYSSTQVPCNRMIIEMDGGTQVLHLQYLYGDSSGAGAIRPLEFAYPTLHHGGAVQSGWPQPASPGTENLPQQMYAEITFRMLRPSLDQGTPGGSTIPLAWWQMSGHPHPPYRQGIEIDYIEINSDSNNGKGWHNAAQLIEWGCAAQWPKCSWGSPVLTSYTDFTQYHKLSVLVTSDQRTNFAKCLFVDAVLEGCQTITPMDVTAYRKDRSKFLNYDVLWVGNNGGNNGPETANPVDVYIKSMVIWECPSYATTNCDGTKWFDDAKGLTYWY